MTARIAPMTTVAKMVLQHSVSKLGSLARAYFTKEWTILRQLLFFIHYTYIFTTQP